MNSRPFVETQIAGDTLDMSIENDSSEIRIDDYPASDGWTLKYRLTPQFATPTQAAIDLTCATDSDGTSYKLQAGPAITANWKAGSYSWARWVEKTGARVTLDVDGQLDVIPDPTASAQGDDRRGHARKMLEQIETALEGFASGSTIKSYTIGTRSFTKADHAEIIALHSRYRWLVANEDARDKIAAGLPNPRNVGVRFVRR
jgi:hypothetical protein